VEVCVGIKYILESIKSARVCKRGEYGLLSDNKNSHLVNCRSESSGDLILLYINKQVRKKLFLNNYCTSDNSDFYLNIKWSKIFLKSGIKSFLNISMFGIFLLNVVLKENWLQL